MLENNLPEKNSPKTKCPNVIYPEKNCPKPNTRMTFYSKNNSAGRIGLDQAKDCISSEKFAGRAGIGKNFSKFRCIRSQNSAGRVGLSQVKL